MNDHVSQAARTRTALQVTMWRWRPLQSRWLISVLVLAMAVGGLARPAAGHAAPTARLGASSAPGPLIQVLTPRDRQVQQSALAVPTAPPGASGAQPLDVGIGTPTPTPVPAPLLNEQVLSLPDPASWAVAAAKFSHPQPPLQTIFAATPAQIASLRNLEQQAIQNTVTNHALPASDADAAATWGRQAAIGELFAEIEQAIQTPAGSRTADMTNAVQWVTSVLQRYQALGAQYAGYEFLKWAGDPRAYDGSYWTFVNSGPSEQAMQGYLTSGQENEFLNDATTGAPIPGWGYCGYQPPSGGSSYTAPGSPCVVPCQSVAGCLPFPPTYNTFVAWGQDDLVDSLLAMPKYNTQAAGIAAAVGLGTAAVLALGITGLVGASVAVPSGIAAVTGGLLGLIWPATVGATVATSSLGATTAAEGASTLAAASSVGAIAGPILVVVGALVAGAFFAVDLFQANTLVPQLAATIADAPTTPYDVSGVLSDKNQLAELFNLLVGASVPTPSLTTCTNSTFVTLVSNQLNLLPPCLNAPPIPAPAQTDYQFSVTAQGSSTPAVTRTLSWVDDSLPTTPVTNSARLSGNWFVETQADSSGTSAPIQTLFMHRVDWAGTPWITELLPDPATGNPKFASVRGGDQQGYALDVSTCASDSTCTLSDTIQFVGTDGKNYTATLVPPLVPLIEATVVTQNPRIGSSVSFDASRSHSPAGLPLTITWQFPVPDSSCVTIFGVEGPTCIDGIVYGSPITGTQAIYTFSDIGTYEVLVTAVDANGESTTLNLPVTISPTAAEAPSIRVAPACPAAGSCNDFATNPGQSTTLHGTITHTYHSVDELNDTIDWGDGTQTAGYAAVFNVIPVLCPASCPPTTVTDAFAATHTYTATGAFTVTVSDSGPFGSTSVTTTEMVKSPLTVTADNQSMTYGGSVPAFTASYSGFVGGDTSSVVSGLTCGAVDGSGNPVNSSTPAGMYTITCAGGSAANYALGYQPGTLTITKAGTSLSLAAAPAPSVFGQTVAITAAVTVKSPGAGHPGGTVEFKDGGTDIAGCAAQPVSTTSETATCTTSSLGVTTHSLTASYSGDPNFVGSSIASALTQTVNKAAVTSALGASVNPATYGQTVTFTATVAAAAPGAGAPTGTVTFRDGAATLGTGSLSTSGGATVATFTASGLGMGTHAITATYGGDGSFLAGAGATLTQYVNTSLSGYPKLANGAYNLSNANLVAGYFVGVSLVGASLAGSNLTGAVLIGANLTGANLSNSNLKGANFTGVNLGSANLSNSNLKGANLSNSNLTGATGLKTAMLTNVVWSKTACPDGTLSNNDGGTCLGHL